MPSPNSRKKFIEDSYYHVYNRGVAKQRIFIDKQDYSAFIRRLMLILLPPELAKEVQKGGERIRLKNFYPRLELSSFCLMPNHYHLALKQVDVSAIPEAMQVLNTSYSMYFNKKYERVGPVFQGRYKASHIQTDEYLLHLSRYIHANPSKLTKKIDNYPYSSLQYMYNKSCPRWLSPHLIESMLTKEGYMNFLKVYVEQENKVDII